MTYFYTPDIHVLTILNRRSRGDVSRFNKVLDLLDQSAVELRRIAHHLMPDSFMHYGLRTSIEDFCNTIPIANFRYYGSDKRLDNSLEIVLY